tara:strand:+ start:225 stop:653 length:429 start_codon:yes stop_codon:yes gene_type:complete
LRPASREFDPREIILISLHQVGPIGLPEAKGAEFAGNIRRSMFEAAVDELHSLQMASFDGESYHITPKGDEFFAQRIHLKPLKKALYTWEIRSGSVPLPPMTLRLREEMNNSHRDAKLFDRAALTVAVLIVVIGLTFYAHAH